MKKRELTKYNKAKDEAMFLLRRGICGSMRDAAVVALCKEFGKASAEHVQMLLIDTNATIIVKREPETLNSPGLCP